MSAKYATEVNWLEPNESELAKIARKLAVKYLIPPLVQSSCTTIKKRIIVLGETAHESVFEKFHIPLSELATRLARVPGVLAVLQYREIWSPGGDGGSTETFYQVLASNQPNRWKKGARSAICLFAVSNPKFPGAKLAGIKLKGVATKDADFSRCDLWNAKICWSAFIQASFRNARLRGADLHHTDFTGSNFSHADLTAAYLVGSKLCKTNLGGVRMYRANLQFASLNDADLEGARLGGAIYNSHTSWPKGFDPKQAGARFVKDEVSGVPEARGKKSVTR